MNDSRIRVANLIRLHVLTLVGIALTGAMASAASFQFLPGTVPEGENMLTVVGDGRFEVADVADPAPNDHRFPVVSAFEVEVLSAGADPGTQMPVVFSLDRVSTTDNHLNFVFQSPDNGQLLLFFDVPGLARGNSIPTIPIADADGFVNWNAPDLMPLSPGAALAGALQGATIVPEPVASGALWLGVVGLAFCTRRRRKPNPTRHFEI